jgi:hypothetical protein
VPVRSLATGAARSVYPIGRSARSCRGNGRGEPEDQGGGETAGVRAVVQAADVGARGQQAGDETAGARPDAHLAVREEPGEGESDRGGERGCGLSRHSCGVTAP